MTDPAPVATLPPVYATAYAVRHAATRGVRIGFLLPRVDVGTRKAYRYALACTWRDATPDDDTPPAMSFVPVDQLMPSPEAVVLNEEEAQRLLDDLLRAGVRPTNSPEKAADKVEAMQAHLDDLRWIAGRAMDKVLGEVDAGPYPEHVTYCPAGQAVHLQPRESE